MRNEKHFRPVHSHGERGVALFFALGILAVLIVIVLVFADRARTDLKNSSAYASNGQARSLAESALSRALLQLQKKNADVFYFYSNVVNDTVNANTVDWLWKIGTEEFSVGANNPMRWQYVKDEENQKIIGRFAYHAIGYYPMDLNALLIHQKGLCGTEDKYGGTGASACAVCAKRLGRSVAELAFDTKPFLDNFTKDKLNGKKTTFSNFDIMKTAFESDHLSNSVYSAINERFAVSTTDSMKELDIWQADKDGTKFFQRFNLNRTDWDTIEVSDLVTAPSHKALTVIEADMKSKDFKNILWLAKWNEKEGGWDENTTKAQQIAANLINYNRGKDAPVVSDVKPVNWNGTNIPKYTGNKRTWYLNEAWISVNAQGTPGAAIPMKTTDAGGKETIHYYKWENPTMKINIELKPEIINMFKKEAGHLPGDASDYSIKTYGTIKYKYEKNNFTFGTDSFTQGSKTDSDEQTVTLSGEVSTAFETELNNYAAFNIAPTDSGAFVHTSADLPVGAFANTTDISSNDSALLNGKYFVLKGLTIDLKLVLYKGAEAVDFVQLTENDLSSALSNNGIVGSGDTYYPYAFSLEVNDPRHNLLAASWTVVPNLSYAGGDTRGTLRKVNSKFSLAGGDTESATDPAADASSNSARISTAYIRHGQMESLWELGAIHRAAPWQTINLKKPTVAPDTADVDFSEKGGEAYAKGDFLLLDQVTFRSSDDAHSMAKGQFGKINLIGPAAMKAFAWDALFRDGKLQNAYDSDDSGTTKLYSDDVELKNYVTNLQKGVVNVNSGNLFRRSDIFRNLDTVDFWKQFIPDSATTDAQQEQRICRFINLTKVNKQGYESAIIVVIAQSINDVGDSVKLPVDWDEDGNPSGRSNADLAAVNAGLRTNDGKTAATLFGATVGNVPGAGDEVTATFGTYDPGVDKITGTVKKSAYFKYDSSVNKWKMIRVKHEE